MYKDRGFLHHGDEAGTRVEDWTDVRGLATFTGENWGFSQIESCVCMFEGGEPQGGWSIDGVTGCFTGL